MTSLIVRHVKSHRLVLPVFLMLAAGSTTFTCTSPTTSKARNTRSSTPKAYSRKRRAEGLVSWPNNPHSHVMSQTGPSFLTLLEDCEPSLTKIKLLLYTPAHNAPTVPCRLVEVGENASKIWIHHCQDKREKQVMLARRSITL